MKSMTRGSSGPAFTRAELLVILFIIAILGAIGLVFLGQTRPETRRTACADNLKRIGTAFRYWGDDYGRGWYQMGYSTNSGGTREYIGTGATFRHFQAMLRELGTPSVLICPTDIRNPATSFEAAFGNSNLSYLIGVDAYEIFPNAILSGDRNITNGEAKGGSLFHFTTNNPAGWTHTMHRLQGHVALADGHVEYLTTRGLRASFAKSGFATNRIELP